MDARGEGSSPGGAPDLGGSVAPATCLQWAVRPATAGVGIRGRVPIQQVYTLRAGDRSAFARSHVSSTSTGPRDSVRAACAAVGEAAGAVESGPMLPGEGDAPVSSDAPAHRSRGRALRDLEECQHGLHLLLDAAVRIGTFDPAARAA